MIGSRLAKAVLMAVFAANLVNTAFAQDDSLTIRFPVEYAADITPGIAIREFAELTEERSEGRIKVELFPNGSLYRGIDLIQAIIRGDAEMTTQVSAYWAGISPKIALMDLPYAFPRRESFYRAADDKEFLSELFSDIEAKGATVLGLLPYDYVIPGSRDKPLISPVDLDGAKLRAIGKVNAATLVALGATAVPVAINEVSTALQQGVIDGLNTPADAFLDYGFYETVRYITFAKYYFAFYPWTVNTAFWERLEQADRDLIAGVVADVIEKHRPRARQAAEDAVANLKKEGVEVHMQTAEEQAAWISATEQVWRDAEAEFGSPFVNTLRSFRE